MAESLMIFGFLLFHIRGVKCVGATNPISQMLRWVFI
jgi:hypothetical protein